MLRKIIFYNICLSLTLQTCPLYGTDLTTLKAGDARDERIENRNARCIKVKKAKSGKIRLAFDKSLEREGANFHLVLGKKTVGRVFYNRGQLNFSGHAGNSFSLESPETYIHPLFRAQTAGDLCVLGGRFTKESAFIAENLTTSGKYKGIGPLIFQARQTLSFQGDYATSRLALQAKRLNLNARGTANVIQVRAEGINEAATNKLFAEKQMAFSGYTQGFAHRGSLKSKNNVVFKGGAYTGHVGSQTLAGCLLQNQSGSITESGRLAAGLGRFQSPRIVFKDLFDFSGDCFIAKGTGILTTGPQSSIHVYYGAKLGTTGKLNHQGGIKQGRILFPSLELFGLGTSPPLPNRTPEEQFSLRRQKMREIERLQLTHLPSIDHEGISLEGTQELVIKDTALLYTPGDNIELKSAKKVLSKGRIQSGLKTIVKAESISLEGQVRANALEINGVIQPNFIPGPIKLIFPTKKPAIKVGSKVAIKPTPRAQTKGTAAQRSPVKVGQKVAIKPIPRPQAKGNAAQRPSVKLGQKVAIKPTPRPQAKVNAAHKPPVKGTQKVVMKPMPTPKARVNAPQKPAVKIGQKVLMKPTPIPKTIGIAAHKPAIPKGKGRPRVS